MGRGAVYAGPPAAVLRVAESLATRVRGGAMTHCLRLAVAVSVQPSGAGPVPGRLAPQRSRLAVGACPLSGSGTGAGGGGRAGPPGGPGRVAGERRVEMGDPADLG